MELWVKKDLKAPTTSLTYKGEEGAISTDAGYKIKCMYYKYQLEQFGDISDKVMKVINDSGVYEYLEENNCWENKADR